MSFVSCVGTCYVCGRMVSFHPNKVPSFKGEPICKACVDNKINPKRIAKGVPPITYDSDAYLGADESEIRWGDD